METKTLIPLIDVKKTFGQYIRVCRNRRGLSQETLAEQADLHRTYVSDVERGTRNLSLQSIVQLADALQVSVADLFPPALQSQAVAGVGTGENPLRYAGILLVEDDPDDVDLTLRSLKRSRFINPVKVVRDGAEALDYLFLQGKYAQRQPATGPQLVLLDLNLPKVDGLEVLRAIKSDPRTRAIHVVILTGSRVDAQIEECRRLGAETCILKPVNFRGLSEITPKLDLDWALVSAAESKTPRV
jgi:CheY-like chemotaxis protein/DNA-binding XRE family transcriptional regulator